MDEGNHSKEDLPDIGEFVEAEAVLVDANKWADRREHERFPLKLHALCRAEGIHSASCTVMEISAGGTCIVSEMKPQAGTSMEVLIAGLGNMHGEVVRQEDDSFSVRFTNSEEERIRLGALLRWLYSLEQTFNQSRRENGQDPVNGEVTLELADGVVVHAQIENVSIMGVKFSNSDHKPVSGEFIWLGPLEGLVLNSNEAGFTVIFDPPEMDVEGVEAA